MNSKKTILLSGNTAWGMYNFRHNLLEHLVEKNYDVYVSAPYDKEYFPKLEKIGCHVINIPVDAKGTNPFKELLLVIKYYKLLKKLKPTLSITYTIKPNIFGSIAARIAHVKYLPVTTGMGYVFLTDNITSKVAKLLYRYSFAKAPQVWFLNEEDVNTFCTHKLIHREQTRCLNGEGIDTRHFAFFYRESHSADRIRFLFVGRLLYDKGLKEYVEAASKLKPIYPQAEFHVLGSYWFDNPSAISKGTMEEWVTSGFIIYDGYSSDVRPALHEADCMVLPSYREGMSCSLMEAASTGLPLVVSDVPGCRELVNEDINGYLCKVKDAESLRQTMEKVILLTQKQRLQMGEASRRLMEKKFSTEQIIAHYDNYLTLL